MDIGRLSDNGGDVTVSVVMCTYNGAKYLPEQLDSILAQTCHADEIIVQDDLSTDGTMAVLHEYARKDPRIKVFSTEESRGINHNFITAIEKAQGDLIAWSDQDDIWAEDKIEKLKAALQQNDAWISFHITRPFAGERPPQDDNYDHRVPNFGLEREVFLGTVSGHTMMFRRSLHQDFMKRFPASEIERIGESFYYDTILSIVGNAYGKNFLVMEPLDFHRRLDSSVSGGKDSAKFERSAGNAIRQVFRNLNPSRRRAIRPFVKRRMDNMERILDRYPDASQTDGVRSIIRAYRSPARLVQFPHALVRQRDKIFYSKEKNDMVARLRAVVFAITYQDYFEICLK
ncbi:MAG: glycosyltransferase [Bacteroidales bacterium]|nr:glycosyltransferase [Bacteroidales bacterium]